MDPTMEGALFVGALIAMAVYGITTLQVHTSSTLPFTNSKLNDRVVVFLLYVVPKR